MNGWSVFINRSVGNPTRLSDIESVKANLMLNRNPITGDYTLIPLDVDGSAASPIIKRASSNDGFFFEPAAVGVSIGGAEVARFDSTGITATLHGDADNALTVNNQIVDSGVENPTIISNNSLISPTLLGGSWCRIGNVMSVSGAISVVGINSGFVSTILSIPVPSAFTAVSDIQGVIVCSTSDPLTGSGFGIGKVMADAAAGEARLLFDNDYSAPAQVVIYYYQYKVLV